MPKKKQIVFFCTTTPYVMIYKIAKEFRKRGYETVLITISQRDKWDVNWYQDGFDKIICSNFQIFKPTPKNLFNMFKRTHYLINSFYEMKKLTPYAVFIIAGPTYLAALAMKFFKNYPRIYFPYDIVSHFYSSSKSALEGGVKMYQIKTERFCFENAEGIFHKGAPDELKHLDKENMLGAPLKTTHLKISFQPYCSDENIIYLNKNKSSKNKKSLHFVHVGGLLSNDENSKIYRNFFRELINKKIHIHLYQKTQHLSKEEDVGNLKIAFGSLLNSKYFHMEFALPPNELNSAISKYDFGMWIPYLDNLTESNDLRFQMGNKISNYFEAGLPIIYPPRCSFIEKVTGRYGLGFPIDMTNLGEVDNFINQIKKFTQKELNVKINLAQKDFNIKKQFPRLEKFIEKVVEKKNYTNLYK